MYSVLNCRSIAKHTEFCLGYLRFNAASTGNVMLEVRVCVANPTFQDSSHEVMSCYTDTVVRVFVPVVSVV
jgi:hypothetical protein